MASAREKKTLTRGDINSLPRELQQRLFRKVPKYALEGMRRNLLCQHLRLTGEQGLADEVLAAVAVSEAWEKAPSATKNQTRKALAEAKKQEILRKSRKLSGERGMKKIAEGLRVGFAFGHEKEVATPLGDAKMSWSVRLVSREGASEAVEIECRDLVMDQVLLLKMVPMDDALAAMLEVAPPEAWKAVE